MPSSARTGLRKTPAAERMHKIAAPWRPYRSVACWYLWRSLDADRRGQQLTGEAVAALLAFACWTYATLGGEAHGKSGVNDCDSGGRRVVPLAVRA